MSANNIVMTKKEAVEEHEHLVRVLRSGKKPELKREAKKQSGELREYKAHKSRGNSRSSSRR